MKKLKKVNISQFLARYFSFEHGVDLNDEVEVLYRRNIVIKNIIFVSNIVYSFILFVISIGNPANGNWLWSVIPFPLTLIINHTINKMIHQDKKNKVRQEIAMYMCSFYMFLSALFVYVKLSIDSLTMPYAEAGYMLLYYSLIVISFYQNTKMLKNVFGWMLGFMTVIHFTLTHHFSTYAKDGFWRFLTTIGTNKPALDDLKDILFRTIVMLIFMLAIYVITDIGEKMSAERSLELAKRKDIQDDFANVLTDLYDVLLETNVGYDDNKAMLPLLTKMSMKLASLYGLSPERCKEINDYVLYNENHHLDLNISDVSTEERFAKLRLQTTVGSMVAKRMQLDQKCDNIVRAHLEGWNTTEFQVKMMNMQNDIDSQIILLCEVYICLRSAKSYKRPYPHKIVIEYFNSQFKIYFNSDLYDRFMKFNKDFDEMYNEAE